MIPRSEAEQTPEPIGVEEWQEKSRAGFLCGSIDCIEPPAERCSHCGFYFCGKHQWIIRQHTRTRHGRATPR